MSAEQTEAPAEEQAPAGASSSPEEQPQQPELPQPEPQPAPAEERRPAEEGPAKPREPRSETERLDPPPVLEMKLESGTEFEVEALKLRQFLRLLRIVTRGAADVLDTAKLDFEDPNAFVQTFLGMVLFSVPEAEEETIDFIKSMVKPKGLSGDPKRDNPKKQDLALELDNPELEDTVTIIQAIVEAESEDLRALGKRLMSMFQAAEKMGATKPTSDQTDG